MLVINLSNLYQQFIDDLQRVFILVIGQIQASKFYLNPVLQEQNFLSSRGPFDQPNAEIYLQIDGIWDFIQFFQHHLYDLRYFCTWKSLGEVLQGLDYTANFFSVLHINKDISEFID